jgi:diguanylate cyclase (GGDEF)-like protein
MVIAFLRFHKPKKYGDNLLDIRYSVKEVNRLKKPMYGFEEGRIYNGFRNVYPISYKNEHLGSVELSMPFGIFKKELEMNFKQKYFFMVDKELVDTKVFKEERERSYRNTFSPDYYFEKGSEIDKKFATFLNSSDILYKLKNKEDIVTSIDIEGVYYTFVFMPIKNTKNIAGAYIVSYAKDPIISTYDRDFLFQLLLLNLIAIVAIIFDSLRRKSKESDFVKDIIDTQDNMLIIATNKKILDVNRSFLKLFGVNSLEEYKAKNSCLCNFLKKEEGYLYANSYEELISILKENKNRNQKIKIHDKKSDIDKIFMIKLSLLNSDDQYLLSLVDVTLLEREKELLEYITTTDTLTKLPNRKKLEDDLDILFEKSEKFSLIMINIDNFKFVNDTYGYQIGDNLVVDIATFLKKTLDSDSLLYRLRAEEFCILSTDKDINNKVDTLNKDLSNHIFSEVGRVKCSFSISESKQGDTKKSILTRVDKALIQSKNCI